MHFWDFYSIYFLNIYILLQVLCYPRPTARIFKGRGLIVGCKFDSLYLDLLNVHCIPSIQHGKLQGKILLAPTCKVKWNKVLLCWVYLAYQVLCNAAGTPSEKCLLLGDNLRRKVSRNVFSIFFSNEWIWFVLVCQYYIESGACADIYSRAKKTEVIKYGLRQYNRPWHLPGRATTTRRLPGMMATKLILGRGPRRPSAAQGNS